MPADLNLFSSTGEEDPPEVLQTYYASPVVQLGMNDSGYAGVYLGIKDIKDQAGLAVNSEKLASYQIDITYHIAVTAPQGIT